MKETAVAPKGESRRLTQSRRPLRRRWKQRAPPRRTPSRLQPEPKGDTKSAAKAEAKAATEAGAESRATVATAAPTTSQPSSTATAASPKPDGYVVQLAAFADDKGANALANKLKKNGYSAYVEPVNTSRGTLWRVRVGGYGTRPEADVARSALKGEGYNGIVTSSQ
jgi:DedD protein